LSSRETENEKDVGEREESKAFGGRKTRNQVLVPPTCPRDPKRISHQRCCYFWDKGQALFPASPFPQCFLPILNSFMKKKFTMWGKSPFWKKAQKLIYSKVQ
jgi:hypothetical protein